MIKNTKFNSKYNTNSTFNLLFMLFKVLLLPIVQIILFLSYYNKNLNGFLIGSSVVILLPLLFLIIELSKNRESNLRDKPLLSLYYDCFTKELYYLNVIYKISFIILVASNLLSILCFIYYFFKN
jgi:hypothetical protein